MFPACPCVGPTCSSVNSILIAAVMGGPSLVPFLCLVETFQATFVLAAVVRYSVCLTDTAQAKRTILLARATVALLW